MCHVYPFLHWREIKERTWKDRHKLSQLPVCLPNKSTNHLLYCHNDFFPPSVNMAIITCGAPFPPPKPPHSPSTPKRVHASNPSNKYCLAKSFACSRLLTPAHPAPL